MTKISRVLTEQDLVVDLRVYWTKTESKVPLIIQPRPIGAPGNTGAVKGQAKTDRGTNIYMLPLGGQRPLGAPDFLVLCQKSRPKAKKTRKRYYQGKNSKKPGETVSKTQKKMLGND